MMNRAVLGLLVVVVAVGFSDAAMVKSPQLRTNLAVGNYTAGDSLLMRQYANKTAIYNTIQSEEITYLGNATTRVTAIRATGQGGTQYATAWVLRGGVGQRNVTVAIQSYVGYGYYYLIEIYGRLR